MKKTTNWFDGRQAFLHLGTMLLGAALAGCGAEAPMDGEAAPALAEPPESVLRVELAPAAAGEGTIHYTLTNASEETQRFLPTDTAIEGAVRDLFEVRLGDEPVEYVGPSVVFAPPSEEQFVELSPGERLTVTVDLTNLYDLEEPGVYSVQARALGPAVWQEDLARGQRVPLLDSPAISISVDAEHVFQAFEISAATMSKALQPACVEDCEKNCLFNDPEIIGLCQSQCPAQCNIRPTCSVSEDNSLNAANAEARRLLPIAIAAINPPRPNPIRQVYLDYFHIRTNDAMAQVNEKLSGARTDISAPRQICLDVGDTVFPGSPATCSPLGTPGAIIAGTNGGRGLNVAYCPQFFQGGLRARAGIVVHEAVHHFGAEDILDANDILVNSRAAAQQLAIANDAAARVSAVNYALYVNDPRF